MQALVRVVVAVAVATGSLVWGFVVLRAEVHAPWEQRNRVSCGTTYEALGGGIDQGGERLDVPADWKDRCRDAARDSLDPVDAVPP